jgi:essential nuclear protein 1
MRLLKMQMLPPELTGKIMKEAQLQQREVTKGEEMGDDSRVRETLAGALRNLKGHVSASDDEDEHWSEPESDFNPEDWEAEIDAEDEAVLSAFMTNRDGNQKQKTLADIIMEKIKEKEENGIVFPDEMRCVAAA